ncbi:MAG: hypothetical protein IJ141_03485 [Lachnospiraceae bacterium]|nr:hypothetical protein [Lachnospiraceae bacterium]
MTSEKLDILMKITDTKNSVLGRALSFDSSYIGRIRTGKRGIPKHMPFIEPAAAFFSKNIKTDYQKKLLSEIICNGKPLPEEKNEIEMLLTAWLKEDNTSKPDSSSIDLLLHELSSANPAEFLTSAPIPDLKNNFSKVSDKAPFYYYGNKGKREATELFLSRLCADEKPHTLLLFSDEDMTWLFEDPAFAKKWASYLIKLLTTGSHIKIIHTINRNLNDLMEAIQKWLPLYIAGDIEPYYYPRLRDGIYHRTLFLAKNKFAIVSNSIGNDTVDMPNLFIEESAVLKGFEKEFNNFLSLCVPLMKIYRKTNKETVTSAIDRFKGLQNEFYYVEARSNTFEKKKSKNINDILCHFDEHDNVIKINSEDKRIPENISILAGLNAGVLVITDKLIFDTYEPNFTMTFIEYLSKL